jgi:4-hydroxy-tetrahydrodipicolinate reductase
MVIKLVVIGAAGRMGRRILSLAAESGRFDIIAAVERTGHPDIGKVYSLESASGPIDVVLTDTYPAAAADVAIDFSQPESVDETIDYCIKNNVALISGTTGLSEKQRDKISPLFMVPT